MFADPMLHPVVAGVLQRHLAPPAEVLDLGAGTGAMSRRLNDLGYTVTAMDVDPDKWEAHEVDFTVLDINRGVAESAARCFDAVVCLEVIEHIENQWQLMRDLHDVLRPGGYAVVSTPNVTSFYSRLYFLRTGRFHHFEPDSDGYGHINPATSWQVEYAAQSAGLDVVAVEEAGALPIFDLSSWHPRRLLINFLRPVAYLLANGRKQGNLLVFVLRRKPNESGAPPDEG